MTRLVIDIRPSDHWRLLVIQSGLGSSRKETIMRFGEVATWKEAVYGFLYELKSLLYEHSFSQEQVARYSLNELLSALNTLDENLMIVLEHYVY